MLVADGFRQKKSGFGNQITWENSITYRNGLKIDYLDKQDGSDPETYELFFHLVAVCCDEFNLQWNVQLQEI